MYTYFFQHLRKNFGKICHTKNIDAHKVYYGKQFVKMQRCTSLSINRETVTRDRTIARN